MNILLQSVTIAFPGSGLTGKTTDVLIKNGKIKSIGNISRDDKAEIIDCKGAYLSPGWVDMQANFADPGNEQKEEISTGIEAASYGGFTNVVLSVETNPPVQYKSAIEYVKSKCRAEIVNILPMAGISKHLEGEYLSEMIDLSRAGAIAFSDGNKGVTNGNLIINALIYAKNFDGLIILHPDDPTVSTGGVMNEGVINTSLGLKGAPKLSEETAIARAISLCEYAEGKLHFSQVSSAGSVELIREAKKKGLKITAGTTIHHLLHIEDELAEFNTNLKFKLPLRTATDRAALRKAVIEGIIDVVISDHSPHEEDRKKCEFELAANGASSIQIMFPLLLQIFKEEKPEFLAKLMGIKPREILKLPVPEFKEGMNADLTVFHPGKEWKFDYSSSKSKSSNSVHFGNVLKGRAIAIINKGAYKVFDF